MSEGEERRECVGGVLTLTLGCLVSGTSREPNKLGEGPGGEVLYTPSELMIQMADQVHS